ncbi:MAG TPA: hydrogenase expression protein HypE [Blastocatellia bacterium]|nr:hydrogenase expression protein HypE [Blastocatellia bacterium]
MLEETISLAGNPTDDNVAPQVKPETKPKELSFGPLKTIHVFWLAGMSCDGCTIAVAGATNPPLENLLTGTIPGLPQVILHHPVLSVEAGKEFVANFYKAERGELSAPYVICYEGSIADERIAAATGGYFSALGAEHLGGDKHRPIPTTEWLKRLAPGAAAVIAIGTCATWGGIPAAAGNPTNSMSVMDFLGKDYRGTAGLPVINIPGCSPVGDNFTETVGMILLFLQGIGPLPEFDTLGRPAWLFDDTVHTKCVRGGYYEEGTFVQKYGDKECLVEVGCWGPVVQCNITARGAINHMGGCMNTGGVCIGCTMPGFPDKFAPFYKTPPGSTVSTNTARTYAAVVRRLRHITKAYQNKETRWEEEGEVPSGWGEVGKPSLLNRVIHHFYQKMQYSGSVRPGDKVGPGSLKAKGKDTPEV